MISKKAYVIGLIFFILVVGAAFMIWQNNNDFHSGQPQLDEVRAAIKQNGSARVIVNLKGNEYTSANYQSDNNKKKEEVAKIQDRALITLNELDFSLENKFLYFPGFSGLITQSGFDKLLANSEVDSVQLDKVVKPN